MSTLDKHAPLKKKMLRANHAPYMTKALRKAIMKRSSLNNKIYKNGTVENQKAYKKQKNYCRRLYFKKRKNITDITDNRKFWKTVKPFFTDKSKSGGNITLVEEEDKIISSDIEVAEVLNNFFKYAVSSLGIEENTYLIYLLNDTTGLSSEEPVEIAVRKYEHHPSILKIKQNITKCNFSFTEVNSSDLEKELTNLNQKNPTVTTIYLQSF